MALSLPIVQKFYTVSNKLSHGQKYINDVIITNIMLSALCQINLRHGQKNKNDIIITNSMPAFVLSQLTL